MFELGLKENDKRVIIKSPTKYRTNVRMEREGYI